MMGGHHAASGAAAWIAVTSSAPIAFGWYPGVSDIGVMTGTLVCAGAALLPDADHHNGTIAHSLPPVSEGLTRIVGQVSGGHRNGTHSILGVLAFTALAWGAGKLSLETEHFGSVLIGPGIMCVLLVAFAMDALKLTRKGVHWPWIPAVALAAVIAVFAPEEWWWMPFSVGLGCVVHLLGDFLTTMGIPLFWPIAPKPPRWVRRNKWLPFDNMWTRGGNFALPILGDAGSVREWIVMTPISLYAIVGFGWALMSQMGFDVDSRWEALVSSLTGLI
ncbi:metal-dependent hydrolase [Nocardioides sp. NPDC126508]